MAHLVADRVRETTTTTGTGNIALGGAVAGFRAFSAVLVNNDTTLYAIAHQTPGQWEVGIGTWLTGNTLVRTTPIAGSAATPVSFAAGTKDVFITLTPTGPVPFSSHVAFAEIVEPAAAPANQMRVFASDQDGVTMLRGKDEDGTIITMAQDNHFIARNTGAQINRGQAVYVSGSSGQRPIVSLAQANADATMPCVGLAMENIATNTQGRILFTGHLLNFNTAAFTEGAKLFLSASVAGALTATEPAHPNLKQRVGIVTNSHASEGRLLVVLGAIRGDHEGTNRNTWIVGDQGTGQKSVTYRRASADHLLRSPDSASARIWDLPDASGTVGLVESATNFHDLTVRSTEPPTPGANLLRVYGRYLAQRAMLKQKGPSGLDVPLQPALFQNTAFMIFPSTGNALTSIGGAVTTVGAATPISHPTPTATSFGYCSNFVTAATANTGGGTSMAIVYVLRGDGSAGQADGFFMGVRFWFPAAGDITAARSFFGFANTTLVNMLAGDNPAFEFAGISFATTAAAPRDTKFGFVIKRTTIDITDTGITVAINKLYDFYMFSPPYDGAAPAMHMELRNVTDGTSAVQSYVGTNAQLPQATTLMRGIWSHGCTTTTAKNYRFKKAYVETDL
jgi:hypothetical protein